MEERPRLWQDADFDDRGPSSSLSPASNALITFDFDDIELGRLLGSGGFSSVYSVTCQKEEYSPTYHHDDDDDDELPLPLTQAVNVIFAEIPTTRKEKHKNTTISSPKKSLTCSRQVLDKEKEHHHHHNATRAGNDEYGHDEDGHGSMVRSSVTSDLTHCSSSSAEFLLCGMSLLSSAASSLTSFHSPDNSASSSSSSSQHDDGSPREDQKIGSEDVEEDMEGEEEEHQFVASNSHNNNKSPQTERRTVWESKLLNGKTELALKTLHCQSRKCSKQIRQGMRGLQTECAILASLLLLPSTSRNGKAPRVRHPNIIQLYGVSADFWAYPETAFLVLEKLPFTLEDKLQQWQKEAKSKQHLKRVNDRHDGDDENKNNSNKQQEPPNAFKWMVDLFQPKPTYQHHGHRHLQPSAQRRRIRQVAEPVASAMTFLHEQQWIIYRDLKPSNIGFDAHGTVKLFDFASAKKLDHGPPSSTLSATSPSPTKATKRTNPSSTRLIASRSGTVRYMAPEVYKKQGTDGYSADVWSFSMLLWEILTLQKPYAKAATNQELGRMVTAMSSNKNDCCHQHRPSLHFISLPSVQTLLRQCWNPVFRKRPSFATIHAILVEHGEQPQLQPQKQKQEQQD